MSQTQPFNSLSIVIPTFNREKILSKLLVAYLAQPHPDLIHEILVVDDGSTDRTESVVREFGQRSPFPIRYFRQANKGPGAARNYGIREAASDLILFTDSDIIPAPDLVPQHLEWHNRNPHRTVAVLGYITWAPEIKATPFMRWCGEDGAVLQFRSLRGANAADYHFFYTGNLSLKTEFLRRGGQFDEDFRTYGYEDLELGHRLNKRGLRLLYNSAAIGYHYQHFSFGEACRKARAKREAAAVFFGKEAGQELLRRVRQRRSPTQYRIMRRMAVLGAKMLFPARLLVDSSIPLPRIVYHLLYWNDATRVLMAEIDDQMLAMPVERKAA